MRFPPLLLALLTALVAAPAAHAATVSITPPSDPVAGVPAVVGYAYDTDGRPQQLSMIARPASGPPCQPSPVGDQAVAGSTSTRYLTGAPLDVQGASGEILNFTFLEAEPTRICAWLYRTVDDVTATASLTVNPRRPRASIAITAQQGTARAGGSGLLATITGESELARHPFALVVPAGDQCPATYDPEVAENVLDRPGQRTTPVQGTFTENLETPDRLDFKRWRLCAYLQDGAEAPEALATASTLIDFVLRPQLLRRPRVKVSKSGAASCHGGRWKAVPAPRLAYTWHADGRKVGKGRAIRVKPGWKKLTCRVVATNKLGKKTGTSAVTTLR